MCLTRDVDNGRRINGADCPRGDLNLLGITQFELLEDTRDILRLKCPPVRGVYLPLISEVSEGARKVPVFFEIFAIKAAIGHSLPSR